MVMRSHPGLLLFYMTVLVIMIRRYCCSNRYPMGHVVTAWTGTRRKHAAFSAQPNEILPYSFSVFHRSPRMFSLFSNIPRKSDETRKSVVASGNIKVHRNVSSDSYGDGGGYGRPVVQWYPGHIAKAERALAQTMKAVDVVVEVRDARIPAATSHPSVENQWCQNKPRIVVLTHADAIPRLAHSAWQKALLHSNSIETTTSIVSIEQKNSTKLLDLSPNQLIQSQAAQVESVRINYNPGNSPTSAAKSSGSNFPKGKQPAFFTPAKAVVFVNAQQGTGIHKLIRAILAAGQHVQDRRAARGLLGRPLRVGVLGYPNVGKSALINKLIGRRRCPTANVPGVTRSLQWIRVKPDSSSSTKRGQEFELLDSPGIIPAVLADQSDAMLLAACHCIGEASYDNQAVASYLCEWMLAVHKLGYHKLVAPHWRNKCIERYKFDPIEPPRPIHQQHERLTGEDILFLVADNTCQGDPEDASRKILQDFRSGRMGPVCLQVAPPVVDRVPMLPLEVNKAEPLNDPDNIVWQIEKQKREQEQKERAIAALAMAKAQGLDLPSIVPPNMTTAVSNPLNRKNQSSISSSIIGKGLFEGW